MSRSKVLIFVIFFVVQLVECFYAPNTTFSLITCTLGIIAILVREKLIHGDMSKLGLRFKAGDIFSSFGYASLFVLVSFFTVFGAEQFIFSARGNSGLYFSPGLELFYSTRQNASAFYTGSRGFILWMIAGVFISLIRAAFFELLFRGLLLRGKPNATITRFENIMQAVAFTIFMTAYSDVVAIQIVRSEGLRLILIAAVCIILKTIGSFLFAYRMGLLRIMKKSIWVCIFQAWAMDYLNMTYHPFAYLSTDLQPYSGLLRYFFLEIVAFTITYPYLLHLAKKARQKRAFTQEDVNLKEYTIQDFEMYESDAEAMR